MRILDYSKHAHYHVHVNNFLRGGMNMKTERVTLLTSPQFKAFLTSEAKREGVSVGELVRTRCEQKPSADDAMLAALVGELRERVREAKKSLKSGLDEAQAMLAELHRARAAAGPKKVVSITTATRKAATTRRTKATTRRTTAARATPGRSRTRNSAARWRRSRAW